MAYDYDLDGIFSWTLDGLGAFLVVPEPASIALLAFGIAVLSVQRTTRVDLQILEK